MMTPTISVIIPVYNAEDYIQRCLYSVLSQTYKDFEIVIINDGSTDNTQNIIKLLSDKHKNITIYTQENKKAAAARNLGIQHASGDYITFIDADDFVSAEYLNILYSNAINYNADVSTCKFYRSSESVFTEPSIEYNDPYVRNNIEVLFECCDINKTAVVSPCCKLYKKELFENIKYPEGRTYEDLAVTHKVLYKAKTIVSTDLPLYCYFNTKESVVHGKYTLLNFLSENQAQDERLVFFAEIGNQELDKKNRIAVERNRITNYCRARKYLPNSHNICFELKQKYDETFSKLTKEYKIGIFNYLSLLGFKYFPNLYYYMLYPIYCLYNSKKWS